MKDGPAKVKMWMFDFKKDSLEMESVPITIELRLEDFTEEAKQDPKKSIWPLLVHKFGVEALKKGHTVLRSDGSMSDCQMEGAESICGIGTLISRFTGVPMIVSPQLSFKGNTIADIPAETLNFYKEIMNSSKRFPVVSVVTILPEESVWGDLFEKKEVEERIIHSGIGGPIGDELNVTTPNPQAQGTMDTVMAREYLRLDTEKEIRQHHSYLLYAHERVRFNPDFSPTSILKSD